MGKKTVSVIIPAYNVEKYIEECLDSIINQSYRDLEIIIVDDGSTDKTSMLADEYAAKDERIKVYHKNNGGASAARNFGFKHSTGEYVYFFDSDDYLEKDAIGKLVDKAVTTQSDFVFCDGNVIFSDYNSNITSEKYKRCRKYPTLSGIEMLKQLKLNKEYYVLVQLTLFRRCFLELINLSFKEGIVFEDELYMLTAYMEANIVSHCHEALAYRRFHPDSVMTSKKDVHKFLSIVAVYYGASELYDKWEKTGKDELKNSVIDFAKNALARYNTLEKNKLLLVNNTAEMLKKHILEHNGYGDRKLLIKSSYGMRKALYKLRYKFGGGK